MTQTTPVADYLEQLAAERAKVKELEEQLITFKAMRDQMMNGCDGHCALYECICEKDQRVIDLHDDVKELEAHNAVLLDALKKIKHPYFYNNDHSYITTRSDEQALNYCIITAEKALSISPSDAAEMEHKKNKLIEKMAKELFGF